MIVVMMSSKRGFRPVLNSNSGAEGLMCRKRPGISIKLY